MATHNFITANGKVTRFSSGGKWYSPPSDQVSINMDENSTFIELFPVTAGLFPRTTIKAGETVNIDSSPYGSGIPALYDTIIPLFPKANTVTGLTTDASPTANSTNPLQSGGAYTALLDKQSSLSIINAGDYLRTNGTNQATNLQALIGSDKTIYFKKGTYSFTAIVAIAGISNLKIIGEQGTIFTSSIANILEFSGNISNIEIEGIKFVTTLNSTTDNHGLLWFHNYNGAGTDNYTMDGISIHDCEFTTPLAKVNGISLTQESLTGECRNFHIYRNKFYSIGRMGIELQNHTSDLAIPDSVVRIKNIWINNNYLQDIGTIHSGGNAVAISITGTYQNIFIDKNEVVDIHTTSTWAANLGIEIALADEPVMVNAQVTNNIVRSVNYGFSAIGVTHNGVTTYTSARDVLIQGNIINVFGVETGDISINGIQLKSINNVSVKNNIVHATGFGVYLQYTKSSVISNNEFYVSKNIVAYINASSNNIFASNLFDNTAGSSHTNSVQYEANTSTGNDLRSNIYRTQDGSTNYVGAWLSATTTANSVSNGQNYFIFVAWAPAATYASATTYYLGAMRLTTTPDTFGDVRRTVIPMNCTLVGYAITTTQGNAASAESSSVYLRLSNAVTSGSTASSTGTDYLLNAAVNFGNANGVITEFYAMDKAVDISAGQAWQIKVVCPTFATAPTTAQIQVTLILKPR